MGRIVNTASTGKQRNQLRRTIAEILRRLSQKQSVDDDAQNMAAMLVFCLREIDEGIQSSAAAWEKRDYWVKAENFREEWRWVNLMADELEDAVVQGRWDDLRPLMLKLFPHFSDINVVKLTRKPSLWSGAYQRLQEQNAG